MKYSLLSIVALEPVMLWFGFGLGNRYAAWRENQLKPTSPVRMVQIAPPGKFPPESDFQSPPASYELLENLQ